MSLLTNYEGLRHQIERLVRENEELKKLVRLIRENHQLKTAIKTQAGVLGISGFSNALGESVTSSTPCQGKCARTVGGQGDATAEPPSGGGWSVREGSIRPLGERTRPDSPAHQRTKSRRAIDW